MQRSIGKKILAVVAGVGLAVGGLTIGPAAADPPTPGGGPDSDKDQLIEIYCPDDDVPYFECFDKPGPGGGPDPIVDPPADDGKVDEGLPSVIDVPAPVAPPCWTSSNCPVGGALQTAVPQYMIAGVPQQIVVYAAWTPDANAPSQPSNGDAVISMDGEPIAAAPFADGKATFNFTPKVPGLKEIVISGVLNSNTSGANAWIDSVDAATMVLPYDPELFEELLKNKKVEVGETFTLEEIAQAKTALGKRLEWRVAEDSSDVCAVTTTKKGEVRAKFTESGKCSIIWTDPKKDEEGKYTFKVTA